MAPKKSQAKGAPTRTSITPKKLNVKSKASPTSVQLPIKSKMGRASSGALHQSRTMSTSLLQEFVKMDQSVNFASTPRLYHVDDMTAHALQEQAQQVSGKLVEEQHIVDAVRSRFEKARAELDHAAARFEEAKECFKKVSSELDKAKACYDRSFSVLAPNIKLAKLRHELAEQRESSVSPTVGSVQLQSASNFEYKKGNQSGPNQHGLHVSFRQLNTSAGSKDWKWLIELADAAKLKEMQLHGFPYNVEAEIGPSTGPSHVETLSHSEAFLEKVDRLQAEAFAYLESSICFKHGESTEPEVLIPRRQKFGAYIELEKESCDGPFKHAKAWLQERQNAKRNVAACFVRRNETHFKKRGDSPVEFELRGLGVLFLRDEGDASEMVCLQVKRDYFV